MPRFSLKDYDDDINKYLDGHRFSSGEFNGVEHLLRANKDDLNILDFFKKDPRFEKVLNKAIDNFISDTNKDSSGNIKSHSPEDFDIILSLAKMDSALPTEPLIYEKLRNRLPEIIEICVSGALNYDSLDDRGRSFNRWGHLYKIFLKDLMRVTRDRKLLIQAAFPIVADYLTIARPSKNPGYDATAGLLMGMEAGIIDGIKENNFIVKDDDDLSLHVQAAQAKGRVSHISTILWEGQSTENVGLLRAEKDQLESQTSHIISYIEIQDLRAVLELADNLSRPKFGPTPTAPAEPPRQ